LQHEGKCYDDKGQLAAGVTVRYGGGVATKSDVVTVRAATIGRGVQGRVVRATPSARFAGTSPKYDIESLNVNKALSCRIWGRMGAGALLRESQSDAGMDVAVVATVAERGIAFTAASRPRLNKSRSWKPF